MSALFLVLLISPARSEPEPPDPHGACRDLQERQAAQLRQLEQQLNDAAWVRQGQYLREELTSRTDPGLAWSLNEVGLLFLLEGRWDEAEALFRRALVLVQLREGQQHPAAGTLLGHLGDVAWARGDVAGAELLHRQSYDLFVRALGADHPRLLASLNTRASLAQAQGRRDDAVELYQQAIRLGEALATRHSSALAAPLHNLALVRVAQGQEAEAGRLLERAWKLLQRDPASEPGRKAVVCSSLAKWHSLGGRVEEAEHFAVMAARWQLEAQAP